MSKYRLRASRSADSLRAKRTDMSLLRRKRLPPPGISALLALLISACSGGSDPVIVTESPFSQPTGNLFISPENITLSEGETQQIQAKIGSASVGATQLTWSVSPSSLATIDNYGLLTALGPGEATITARYTSMTANSQARIWPLPHVIEPASDTFQVAVVGRAMTDSIEVRAVSDEGLPVPGVEVSFQVLEGGGTVTEATKTTGLNGVASVFWDLGTRAGRQELRATAPSLGKVVFGVDGLPDYDSAEIEALEGDDQQGQVDSFLPVPLRARVVDQFGNSLPGINLTWTFTGGGGAMGAGPESAASELLVPTDAEGITEVFWKLGIVAGVQEAVCYSPASGPSGSGGQGGQSGAPMKARGKKFRASADPGVPESVKVDPDPVRTLVGFSEPLTANVTDAYGNIIPTSEFTWSADDPQIVAVDPNGTVTGVSLGTASVRVRSKEFRINGSAPVTVEGSQPTEILVYSGGEQSATVGSDLPAAVVVVVRDQVGNPVPGVKVHWGASPGSGSVEKDMVISDGSGLAQNSWTLGTAAGQQSLVATGSNVGAVLVPAEALPGEPETLQVSPASLNMNSVGDTARVSVLAWDTHGNYIPGLTPQWSSSDPGVVTVNSSGLVTSAGPGGALVVASLSCCAVSENIGVTVSQTPHLIEVDPAFSSIEAGESVQFTATVTDINGQDVFGALVTWSSDDPSVATVGAKGLVTGSGPGNSPIRASIGQLEGSGQITVLDPVSPTPPPETVGDLTVVDQSSTSITLRWTQVNGGTDSPANYALRYSSPSLSWGSGEATEVSVQGTTIGSAMEYTWSGLNTALTYEFQLVSFRGTIDVDAEFGSLSNKATGITYTSPGTVADLEVIGKTENTVTLRWTQVNDGSGDPAKYALRNGTPSIKWGGAYPTEVSMAGTGIGTPIEYTWTGLASGTRHEFKLVPYRGILMVDVSFGGLSNTVATTTDSGAGDNPQVDRVAASPSSFSFTALEEAGQAQASALDASGSVVPGATITWTSLDPSTVTVDQRGLLRANGTGSTKVVASVIDGGNADTISVVVSQVPASLEAFPGSLLLDEGESQQFNAIVRDHKGNTIPLAQVQWSSTDAGVASIDQTGLVTAVAEGTADLRATSGGAIDTETVSVKSPYTPPPPSDGLPFFSDDFETGDRSKAGGARSFKWRSAANTTVSTMHPRTGSYSLKFLFKGGEATSDAWAEQRFTFDPIRGSAETWIEYYVYYADGTENPSLGPAYYNRDMIGDSDGHKLGRLWGGTYTGGSFMAGFSAESGSHVNGSDKIGASRRRSDGVNASAGGTGLIPGLPGVNGNPEGTMVRGAWMQIREHYRASSSAGAKDGVIQLWINGELKYDKQGLDFYHPDGPSAVYFDSGYLLGWSNAGFDEETYVFIDDIRFFDNSPGW